MDSVSADPKVQIDKLRIQQIVINLVQNSIKYSKKGDSIKVVLNQTYKDHFSSSDSSSEEQPAA